MFLHYPNQYICLTFHNKITNEINLSKILYKNNKIKLFHITLYKQVTLNSIIYIKEQNKI